MPGKTPEEVLAEARKFIGYETKPVWGRYPVEAEAIRRWCHMADNSNPLYLDPEYAKNTKFGGIICPPCVVQNFAGRGLWPVVEEPPEEARPNIPSPGGPEGSRAINLTTDWEFYKPVKVGDRISQKFRIADVYIKGVRYDPQAFWTVTETIFENQNGETVAKITNTGLRHRTPEQLKADGVEV